MPFKLKKCAILAPLHPFPPLSPFRFDPSITLTSPSASFYLFPFPPHPLSFLPLLFLVPFPTILRLLPSNPPIRVRIRIRIRIRMRIRIRIRMRIRIWIKIRIRMKMGTRIEIMT